MNTDRQLIAQRGGIRGLARELGHKWHTTVQGWWERERIPEEHREAVLAIEPKRDAA